MVQDRKADDFNVLRDRWTKVDGVTDHFLLGDIYGKLLALEIVRSPTGKVVALQTRDLGDVSRVHISICELLEGCSVSSSSQTSSPTSLVFLSSSSLYLSSRFGDSQLIRLPSSLFAGASTSSNDQMDVEGEEEADGIQLVASFASLAPILDCCVVEGEGGGAVSLLR